MYPYHYHSVTLDIDKFVLAKIYTYLTPVSLITKKTKSYHLIKTLVMIAIKYET